MAYVFVNLKKKMCPAPLVGLQGYQHLFLESILQDLPTALLQVASIHCKIMIKDITCKTVEIIYRQVLCSVPVCATLSRGK